MAVKFSREACVAMKDGILCLEYEAGGGSELSGCILSCARSGEQVGRVHGKSVSQKCAQAHAPQHMDAPPVAQSFRHRRLLRWCRQSGLFFICLHHLPSACLRVRAVSTVACASIASVLPALV